MRSLLLVPWSLSRIVVGLLWIGILDFEFGAFNGYAQRLGLLTGSIAFFKDGFSALNVLVSVYMWNQAPFATLLFLAQGPFRRFAGFAYKSETAVGPHYRAVWAAILFQFCR